MYYVNYKNTCRRENFFGKALFFFPFLYLFYYQWKFKGNILFWFFLSLVFRLLKFKLYTTCTRILFFRSPRLSQKSKRRKKNTARWYINNNYTHTIYIYVLSAFFHFRFIIEHFENTQRFLSPTRLYKHLCY